MRIAMVGWSAFFLSSAAYAAPSDAVPPATATAPKSAYAQQTSQGAEDFCAKAHLAVSAYKDCQGLMDKAQNENDRARIEEIFAMGNVAVDIPAVTTQSSK